MENKPKILFKNVRQHVADAIKESCYRSDARLYNIANEVHHIQTFSVEVGIEVLEGLSKIFDRTIKDAVDLDCDVSVIAKGLMLGAFRSAPFTRTDAPKIIHMLISEVLQYIIKYKGDFKQAIVGILAAIVIIAKEFKLNMHESLVLAKEDISSIVKGTNADIVNKVKEILSNLDEK